MRVSLIYCQTRPRGAEVRAIERAQAEGECKGGKRLDIRLEINVTVVVILI